jgi:hypothetical protein
MVVGLLAQIQKVELVGGGDWLSQNLGSILLAIAAVSAAFLAAWVAKRNVEKELTNDRLLRNRDHIRDTIDGASSVAGDARIAVDDFLETAQALETARDKHAAEEAGGPSIMRRGSFRVREHEETLDRQLAPTREHLARMREMGHRLELRLDEHHLIVTSYKALRAKLREEFGQAQPVQRTNREQAVRGSDQVRLDAVDSAFGAFRKACYAWFND